MTSYSYQTVEKAVNNLEGAARQVYNKIMINDKYTGPSTYLARVFVGLSIGVPVNIHNPSILQTEDMNLLFGLYEQARGFSSTWHDAALLISKEYALGACNTQPVYGVAQ